VVDDGVEGQAVPEAVAEVLDVNVVVLRGHLAAPDLERSETLLLNRRHDAVANQHLIFLICLFKISSLASFYLNVSEAGAGL